MSLSLILAAALAANLIAAINTARHKLEKVGLNYQNHILIGRSGHRGSSRFDVLSPDFYAWSSRIH